MNRLKKLPKQPEVNIEYARGHIQFTKGLHKAVEWMNQPDEAKRKSPFYEEYLILSPFVKKDHVAWEFMNEEEKQVLTDASDLQIQLRRKFDPTFSIGGEYTKWQVL